MARSSRPLSEVAGRWATPRASDSEKEGPNQRGSKGDLALAAQAARWPVGDNGGPLPLVMKTDGARGSRPVCLHPSFVETLMGLPIGWTAFEPLATESSRHKPPSRSES